MFKFYHHGSGLRLRFRSIFTICFTFSLWGYVLSLTIKFMAQSYGLILWINGNDLCYGII